MGACFYDLLFIKNVFIANVAPGTLCTDASNQPGKCLGDKCVTQQEFNMYILELTTTATTTLLTTTTTTALSTISTTVNENNQDGFSFDAFKSSVGFIILIVSAGVIVLVLGIAGAILVGYLIKRHSSRRNQIHNKYQH